MFGYACCPSARASRSPRIMSSVVDPGRVDQFPGVPGALATAPRTAERRTASPAVGRGRLACAPWVGYASPALHAIRRQGARGTASSRGCYRHRATLAGAAPGNRETLPWLPGQDSGLTRKYGGPEPMEVQAVWDSGRVPLFWTTFRATHRLKMALSMTRFVKRLDHGPWCNNRGTATVDTGSVRAPGLTACAARRTGLIARGTSPGRSFTAGAPGTGVG